MNALALRSLSLGLVAAMVVSLAACGGASEAKAPGSHEAEPEPLTIEEAQDQISRARDRLASAPPRAQPNKPSDGAPAADSSRQAEPSPPPTAQTTEAESASRPSASKAGRAVEDGRCSSPCRALASMRRAVTALCRMAGDTDNRCRDAKRTLADSEGRISPCSC